MNSPESSFPKPIDGEITLPQTPEVEVDIYDLPIDLTDVQYDPETFKRNLLAKRDELIQAMHRKHEENLEKFPGYSDSVLPGAKVAILSRHIGKKWENVIEREAYWANDTGGVFYQMRDILPSYHPYWLAVAESGFIPEVRRIAEWGSHGVVELYARLNRPSFKTGE